MTNDKALNKIGVKYLDCFSDHLLGFGIQEIAMSFFSWWAGQSPWLRYGIAILLIAVSTAIYFAGDIWPWGWIAGIILLMFSGPSSSEKKGYHF